MSCQNILIIVNTGARQTAEWYCIHLIIVLCLCHRRFNKLYFVYFIKDIINRLCKSGINILIHRTAKPVNIHIRALSGAHRDCQLLFVSVILCMDLCYGDIRIISHKALYCTLLGALRRILCCDIPQCQLNRILCTDQIHFLTIDQSADLTIGCICVFYRFRTLCLALRAGIRLTTVVALATARCHRCYHSCCEEQCRNSFKAHCKTLLYVLT